MKVLIVGWGLVAQRHARHLKQIEPSIQLGLWRQRPDSFGKIADIAMSAVPAELVFYEIAKWREWEPDAAIIANPASMHVDAALVLAAEMVHLFVEKPISHSIWRVSQLIDACRNPRCPRVLMVGYDLRFYRPLQMVYEAIQAGRIGRPMHIRCEVGQYLPDWRPGRDYRTSVSARRELGGGVLLELSHEIDYARWLMGEVVSVSAMTGRLSDLEIDVEDTADLLLRFESGALGNIHMDMTDRYFQRTCRVVGSEGTLHCDLKGGVTYLLPAVGEWQTLVRMPKDPDAPENDLHYLEMRHFLACCRGEAVPVVSGEDARKTLAVVEAAKQSAAGGGTVAV